VTARQVWRRLNAPVPWPYRWYSGIGSMASTLSIILAVRVSPYWLFLTAAATGVVIATALRYGGPAALPRNRYHNRDDERAA
jgi:hypothetical protein